MKRNAFILLGCWMLISTIQISAQAKSQHLGLISDLVQIKCESELNLAQSIHRSDSAMALQKYMTAYTLVNGMISQLEADMVAANSISRYKKIDKALKSDDINTGKADDALVQRYLTTLQAASVVWKNDTDKSFAPLTALSTAVDITDTAVGIIKTISDLKQSKVKGICQCLDGVRLAPYSDIVKAKASAR